jgi:hypothetical protein
MIIANKKAFGNGQFVRIYVPVNHRGRQQSGKYTRHPVAKKFPININLACLIHPEIPIIYRPLRAENRFMPRPFGKAIFRHG